MSRRERPLVKICGVTRREDALEAARLGADYVGVILSAGFARSVDPAVAPERFAGVGAIRVAVLVDEDEGRAAELASSLGAGVVQLHGSEDPETAHSLRARGPWQVWKSVRARGPEDVLAAFDRYGGSVDGILVEGFREGVVGGGGVPVDLDAIAATRDAAPAGVEVILAGGLTPENVRERAARFRPDVVDVSSGVERELGRKDPELMRAFLEGAARAP